MRPVWHWFGTHRTVTLCGSLAGCALVVLALWYNYHLPQGSDAQLRTLVIAPKAGIRTIAAQLVDAGVLRQRWAFVFYALVSRSHARLRAGEYALRPTMSLAEMLEILRQGKVLRHTLTIPEGATVRDIAALVAAKGLGERQALLDLAQDRDFLKSVGLTAASLEGYVFPETYHVPRSITAAALWTIMVRTMQARYTSDMAARGQRLGLTQHQVFTLASLIEKEARVDAERPLIAAVFHNRLHRGMRLQCDATVVYALGEQFDGNIRKRDLEYDSPYNTYRYAGLPPGPIASPGQRALEAAVAPASVDYLYFVATKQHGTHHFSTTLAEHNRAVQHFQLGPRPSTLSVTADETKSGTPTPKTTSR